MFGFGKKLEMPSAADALPGRAAPIPTAREHFVFHRPLKGPYPDGLETAMFGIGCFWGAERKFWELGDGIYITAVGYAAATRRTRPTRRSARAAPATTRWCSWSTTRRRSPTRRCCKTFWENHDPTQGMRQGNDVGTQYRSGIYAFTPGAAQGRRGVEGDVRAGAQGQALRRRSPPRSSTRRRSISPRTITSSISRRIPTGYCGLGGTGVSCPIGTGVAAAVSRTRPRVGAAARRAVCTPIVASSKAGKASR